MAADLPEPLDLQGLVHTVSLAADPDTLDHRHLVFLDVSPTSSALLSRTDLENLVRWGQQVLAATAP